MDINVKTKITPREDGGTYVELPDGLRLIFDQYGEYVGHYDSGGETLVESDGYGIAYSNAVRHKGLTIEARAIYAVLCTYVSNDRGCLLEKKTLCDDLNITKKRLDKHMRILVNAGLLAVERRSDGRPNTYRLLDLPHDGGVDDR